MGLPGSMTCRWPRISAEFPGGCSEWLQYDIALDNRDHSLASMTQPEQRSGESESAVYKTIKVLLSMLKVKKKPPTAATTTTATTTHTHLPLIATQCVCLLWSESHSYPVVCAHLRPNFQDDTVLAPNNYNALSVCYLISTWLHNASLLISATRLPWELGAWFVTLGNCKSVLALVSLS